MRPTLLPDPIAAYCAADSLGGGVVARCFTAHAVVKDEGHTYAGVEAITAWKTASSGAYAYTSRPIAVAHEDGVHIVTSRVSGNFPGSPIDLRYRFRLERGLIAELEITP